MNYERVPNKNIFGINLFWFYLISLNRSKNDPYCAWDRLVSRCISSNSSRSDLMQGVADGSSDQCPGNEVVIPVAVASLRESEKTDIGSSIDEQFEREMIGVNCEKSDVGWVISVTCLVIVAFLVFSGTFW